MSGPANHWCYFVVLFVAPVPASFFSFLSLGWKHEWVIEILKLQIKDSLVFQEGDRGVCLCLCSCVWWFIVLSKDIIHKPWALFKALDSQTPEFVIFPFYNMSLVSAFAANTVYGCQLTLTSFDLDMWISYKQQLMSAYWNCLPWVILAVRNLFRSNVKEQTEGKMDKAARRVLACLLSGTFKVSHILCINADFHS